ncbi:uncharacterized protein A4U43_C06F1520 [Asparagus officinalis]|uniref:Uncharacterized protein n=1 Tax=Asparagus officinalis TaxID=4686 RepID=A0A5P1EMR1_ASPOF|nr:uncharacterized protein A4U43_C06F1520 [Asparagus officinalis]
MGSHLHHAVAVCRGWVTKVPRHFRWATASLEELICEKKHNLKAAAIDDDAGGVDPESAGGPEGGNDVVAGPDAPCNNTKFKQRVFVYLYSILLFNSTIILDSVSYVDPIPKLVLVVDLASFLTGAIMILLLHSISPKPGFVKFVACCMTLMMIATGLSILIPEIARPRTGRNGRH